MAKVSVTGSSHGAGLMGADGSPRQGKSVLLHARDATRAEAPKRVPLAAASVPVADMSTNGAAVTGQTTGSASIAGRASRYP